MLLGLSIISGQITKVGGSDIVSRCVRGGLQAARGCEQQERRAVWNGAAGVGTSPRWIKPKQVQSHSWQQLKRQRLRQQIFNRIELIHNLTP